MQINEVERLVGVTKKNIRFYEQEGLLAPSRQAGNGYRNYSEADVARLEQIKLLRKLDVPLGEIGQMLAGQLPLAEGMRRHLITLEHRQANLASAQNLTAALAQEAGLLADLDAKAHLAQMDELEKKGVRFINIQKQDKARRYRGAVMAAAVFMLLMAALEGMLAWAMLTDPIPWPLALGFMAVPAVMVIGVLLALRDRFRQIEEGEEDLAAKY